EGGDDRIHVSRFLHLAMLQIQALHIAGFHGPPGIYSCGWPAFRGRFALWPESWGARIRTSDWLIQSQLPYHLATPQRLRERGSECNAAPFGRPSAGLYWNGNGPPRTAPLPGPTLPVLSLRREHGELRHQRARAAGEPGARTRDVRRMQRRKPLADHLPD